MNLSEIESRINQLAQIIAAPGYTLPTYGYSEQSGRLQIEMDASGYHCVASERGRETYRLTSPDIDEILYDVFQGATFEMACRYARDHRLQALDFRRVLFEQQEELIRKLSPSWEERLKAEHARILQEYPFSDPCDAHAAYAQELKEQGLSPVDRWKMVVEKYPPPE